MAKYKAYPEYKDSGVEWLGEIPTYWQTLRGKYVFKEVRELSTTGDETLLSVSEYYGVKPRQDTIEDGDFISRADSLIGYKKCQVNDLAMNIMLAWKTGLGVSNYDGIISPAYSVFRFDTAKAQPEYMHYLLRTKIYTTQFKSLSTGVIDSRLRLYPETFGIVEILLPSLGEQKKICAFLSHETAKIDNLIEKQQQLIELLKEKRQAVISHAVTKGLNPYVPMKDSGVEWLGEVPAHWDICLLKFKCSAITDGAHISADTNEGKHYFVSIKDIKKGIIDFNNSLLTSSASYKYLVKTGCKPFSGDILFSKDGTIGQTAIVPDDVDFVVASSLIIIRADKEKALPAFMDLLLQSSLVKEQVESFVKGAALRRLSIQNLEKVFGVFPTLSEQLMISDYIYAQLNRLDVLESKAVAQIQLLEERRTALISAAVTGKIDVRDWVAPDTQKAEKPEETAV